MIPGYGICCQPLFLEAIATDNERRPGPEFLMTATRVARVLNPIGWAWDAVPSPGTARHGATECRGVPQRGLPGRRRVANRVSHGVPATPPERLV
jgi:hypothetical protein